MALLHALKNSGRSERRSSRAIFVLPLQKRDLQHAKQEHHISQCSAQDPRWRLVAGRSERAWQRKRPTFGAPFSLVSARYRKGFDAKNPRLWRWLSARVLGVESRVCKTRSAARMIAGAAKTTKELFPVLCLAITTALRPPSSFSGHLDGESEHWRSVVPVAAVALPCLAGRSLYLACRAAQPPVCDSGRRWCPLVPVFRETPHRPSCR